jgi:CubicO group peptidase (beta-lactamase class C family)
VDFFPEWSDELRVDSRKSAIRLEDLLTMRSGTDYREGYEGSPHNQLNSLARGWDRFYLDRPMVREPGTYFQYDSGGVILMSSLLQRRTGSHADTFADEYLFADLGITRSRWYRNGEGHPHTGGGLHLSSRDMAKFGLLYLRGGRWMNRQVVPKFWVDISTSIHVPLEQRGYTVGYGYLWWILQPDAHGVTGQHIYAAMGFRAQYIFVVPEHDMVVVVTGGTESREDQIKPVLFLYSHILPAVTR